VIPLRDNVNARTTPFISWALISANIYIFYRELTMPSVAALDEWIHHWAVVPARLWSNLVTEWPTLLSAAFLHGGWGHIFGNLLFLYVFGRSVEDRMGHFRFLTFYLAIGMFANGVQAYISPNSTLPLLGASGAIAGVLGAYFFYYPYAKILTLIPIWIFSRIIEIPAFIFLGLWFVVQMLAGAKSLSLGVRTLQDVGGVAWWAHASGFIGGMLIGPALSKKKRPQ